MHSYYIHPSLNPSILSKFAKYLVSELLTNSQQMISSPSSQLISLISEQAIGGPTLPVVMSQPAKKTIFQCVDPEYIKSIETPLIFNRQTDLTPLPMKKKVWMYF